MSKVITRKFIGSPTLFILLFLTGFGIPLAILYLLRSTVDIEEDVSDVNLFLAKFKSERWNN